jgi:hypothetical protein
MLRYLSRYNYSTISKTTTAATTTKAASVHIPTHREQKANPDHITQLADYDTHFALKDIPLKSGIKGVKLEVLLSMVDAFSENPTFTLDQKKDALEKAVRFMKGEKNEVKLESLSGTPQQKSYELHLKTQ